MTDQAWGYFAGGRVHIICSSHNDIAWFDTPEETSHWRDRDAITPALEHMAQDPTVCFAMENVLYLLEYLGRHPERRELIERLIRERRFDWGATYNQPLETLLSGEQLVRQLYFGRRVVQKLFPGADPRVAYSPDVPGRAMQMPQILAKSGVPYLVISRHKAGLFYWASPDGSRVLTWSMGHYVSTSIFARELDGSLDEVRAKVQRDLDKWGPIYAQHGIIPEYAYLYSEDYIPPADFDAMIAAWNAMEGPRPELRYATPGEYLEAVAANDPALPQITGERPDLWVYIHGPAHHRAISAKRDAARMLPQAEMLHAVAALVSGHFDAYPSQALNRAWVNALYDDHGWGGVNGHITDETFRRRLETARHAAAALVESGLQRLTAHVRTDGPPSGIPVVLVNTLNWARRDVVRCAIPLPSAPFSIVDGRGQTLPHQLVTAGVGTEIEIAFISPEVPPLGYTTVYIVRAAPLPAPDAPAAGDPQVFESDFYCVTLAPGGIASLIDRDLGLELLETRKFLGAEVFMLESTGNGAHDYSSVQLPNAMGDFERASQYKPVWTRVEDGPVYSAYRFIQQLRNCVLIQTVTCYKTIKRIDVTVSLFNFDGIKSREYRLAFPLRQQNAEISYEIGMGVATIGVSEIQEPAGDGPVYAGISQQWGVYKTGPTYPDQPSDVHPRTVQNFISSSDHSGGVTISTSVAAFDHVDPMTSPPISALIQPILLASRKSNHPQGNWYLQAGDHHFTFSLTSHAPGWLNGWQQGIAANTPLLCVAAPEPQEPVLSAEHSFLIVNGGDVLVTAFKKSEEGDALILRLCEIAGRDTPVTLRPGFVLDSAARTDMLESGPITLAGTPDAVAVTLGHHAVETLLLRPLRT